MAATEAYTFSNVSTDQTFDLTIGGMYGLTAHATWGGGSATLEILAADGSTYLTAATAISADGYATAYLPPGSYKLHIATATAVYFNICRIPLE